MQIVVPLAGPDFELNRESTKAEISLSGEPLLLRTLTSRSWWRRAEVSSSDLVFVLRDTVLSRRFSERSLRRWFPEARMLFLSHSTQGAAFSALAGVSLCDPEDLLCVDLADILYVDDFRPAATFAADPALGGVVPTFLSSWPLYSYVELDEGGRALRSAEKSVISDHASAGTYFFRNSAIFAAAIAYAIKHRHEQTYRGNFFICPLFNGVIASGHEVRTCTVSDVVDIKQDIIPSK